MLDNKPNQPTKFRTENWIEINDESCGTYNTNNQIKFKTSVLRSSLCDNSDAYILVSGTIKITGARADDAAKQLDERNKEVVFKNCAPFTDCTSEINNIQIDNAKYIDVMPMYNLIEHSNIYSKTSGSLWQCYIDDPNDNITQSESFKLKIKTTAKSPVAGNTKNVETLEMLLINCEINLILNWFSLILDHFRPTVKMGPNAK